MSKADTGGGFLSRLFRSLRHWVRLRPDVSGSAPVQDLVDDVLQGLIARKRQNDFVRYREFDALRKIRSRARAADDAFEPRPTQFQSSLPSPVEDRASTLQKINEIEAQMSRQWWTANDLPGVVSSSPHPSGWMQGDESRVDSADFRTTSEPPADMDLADTQPLPYSHHPRSAPIARANWTAPPRVDASAVAGLQRALNAAPQPCVLDWSALTALDMKAAHALLGLFSLWADEELHLHWVGADVLQQRLMASTPVGRRDVEQVWWELRMATLRLMNRPIEFERVARDCCALHDMPRPAWEPPRCTCICPGLS